MAPQYCSAFLFDMDGVLVDSRAVVERTWRRWAQRHGLDAEFLIQAAQGRRTSDTLREVAPDLATAEEVDWLDGQELIDFDGVVAVPGAAEFLARLGSGDWALVTSSGRDLALKRLGVAGLPIPPVMICGEDVTRGKPDPEPYFAGARAVRQPNAKCLVFEDAPAGIAAGIASGASVIAIATTYSHELLGAAHAIVADFRSVRAERGATGWVVSAEQ